MAPDNRIQTRVSPDLHAWLVERAGRSHTGDSAHQQAGFDLAMLRALLDRERDRIRLSLREVSCLAEVARGTLISVGEMAAYPALVTDAADAFQLARDQPFPGEEPYGEKWGINEERLVAYLRSLGPTADHALYDAISRWWGTKGDARKASVEGWAKVGLRISDTDAPRCSLFG